MLSKMKKNSTFMNTVIVSRIPQLEILKQQQCESNPACRGLKLLDYLIKPVQRLCKYTLLLREIERATPDAHPEIQDLKLALEKITSIVNKVNATAKESVNISSLISLEERLSDMPQVSPS